MRAWLAVETAPFWACGHETRLRGFGERGACELLDLKRRGMADMNAVDEAWWRRYTTAAERLDQTAGMVALQRLVTAVDVDAPPSAVAVAGAARLQSARRVGLFAGSFNPLTLAHVALARAARREGRLDLVVWACAAVTVDKERVARASLPDRLAQMAAYVRRRQHDALVVLNHGLYVDEARALRTLLPQDAELTILLGFDKIVQIFDPRYYEDRDAALDALFAEARLLVAPRDGAGKTELDALLARPENRVYAEQVGFMPLRAEYARDSSTEARQCAAQEARPPDLADLLPPEGAALAGTTGAYRAAATPERDPYLLRQQWLQALQGESPRLLQRLPGLSTLVALTVRTDETGKALRRYLTTPKRGEVPIDVLVARARASASPDLSPAPRGPFAV
jgi:nicotinamide-nucleotide adenylyltransferase